MVTAREISSEKLIGLNLRPRAGEMSQCDNTMQAGRPELKFPVPTYKPGVAAHASTGR